MRTFSVSCSGTPSPFDDKRQVSGESKRRFGQAGEVGAEHDASCDTCERILRYRHIRIFADNTFCFRPEMATSPFRGPEIRHACRACCRLRVTWRMILVSKPVPLAVAIDVSIDIGAQRGAFLFQPLDAVDEGS